MVNALCIPIRKIKNCGNKKADNLEIFFFFPHKGCTSYSLPYCKCDFTIFLSRVYYYYRDCATFL